MSTLEEVLDAVAEAGFKVNNLFQLDPPGAWRANLRAYPEFYEFGDGDTPVAALIAALGKTAFPATRLTPEMPLGLGNQEKLLGSSLKKKLSSLTVEDL